MDMAPSDLLRWPLGAESVGSQPRATSARRKAEAEMKNCPWCASGPCKRKNPCVPASRDDHMAREPYRGPIERLLPSTVLWLKKMLEDVNAGHARRSEEAEVWFDADGFLI